MTNFDDESGASREQLVQRVALMEEMIAEGRRNTGRFGWIFILWGSVCLAGLGLSIPLPHSYWVWPVVIAAGFAIQFAGIALQRRSGFRPTTKSRSLTAVWRMMGLSIILLAASAIASHKVHEVTYIAAIFFFLGMAHATSAMILRWPVQGVVAALWWAGGIATYFVSPHAVLVIYVAEMVVCMVLFGVYATFMERRRATGPAQGQVSRHA